MKSTRNCLAAQLIVNAWIAGCAAAAGIWAAGLAQGSAYPERPIRFIVPSTPAGPTDIQVRLLAEHMSNALGRQVIVDNRAGAGGRIGLEAAARSQPDGYTIFFGSQGNLVVNPLLHKVLPYKPESDFAPIVLATRVRYLLLATPSVPVSAPKDLIALLRAHPGQYNFASVGTGTSSHISGELFKKVAKVDLTHVPYKGATPALTDLLAGQVQFMFASPVASAPYIANGRLKAIAIAAPRRSALFPNVPTFDEAGLANFEASTWFGVLTRTGVPPALIVRLNDTINRILRQDEVRSKLATLDAEPAGSTPEEFATFLRAERSKWSVVLKEAGIKID